MELRGQRALVTGGAVRVGRAISLALARCGCHLVVHYGSSREAAEATCKEAKALGVTTTVVAADLEQKEGPERLLDAAGAEPITILVNSAAHFLSGGLLETTQEAWDRQHALNLRAPFFLAQEFVRRLPLEAEAAIVNIADGRVLRAGQDHLAYRLTKAALAELSRCLAVELAPWITVNAVLPGAILPPPGEDESAFAARVARDVPLTRPGGPEAVADAVVYLLSQRFLTGVLLPVDGGQFL